MLRDSYGRKGINNWIWFYRATFGALVSLPRVGHLSSGTEGPILSELSSLGITPILGDVRDGDLISQLVPDFDGVVNLAGLFGTAELIDDPIPAINTNLIGAVNVFQACRRAKQLGRAVKCVQITVGNYFMDNSYSITKSTSERFAAMFNAEHGTDIRIVRVLNAYGEHQRHYPVKKIVPTFVRAALLGEPIRVYGDGEQIMDMIYVGDVARILAQSMIEQTGVNVISAGIGRKLTVNQIAEMIVRTTKSSSTIEHVPMRAGEPPRSIVLGDPTTLLKIKIDPASLLAFEEGLQRTLNWYQANKMFLDIS